jgi:hypothetical protein
MESLDRKLGRLSREQQRQVEDFVDFLLQRSQTVPEEGITSPMATLPSVAPPAPPVQDSPGSYTIGRINDLIDTPDNQQVRPDIDPATLLIQEIASEKADIITSDYMDYGSFEPGVTSAPPPPSPSSPADEAVQRVKVRLTGKKNAGPAQDMLDWID